jgi:serine-type D-Ala-D-Ala carboxypeptidase (penicillin-binding protein 5/6)
VSPLRRRRLVACAVVVAAIVFPSAIVGAASPALRPPPPTPVPPNGSLSPFPSVVHTPSDATVAPQVSAGSALLADLETGAVLFRKATDLRRPIASLTKIMTALLTFERTEPSDVVTVDPRAVFADDDYGASSTVGLRAGERLSVHDLLAALLLGSANDAAAALAIHVSGSEDGFVQLMNRRAARLGMRDTRFASPNGLDDAGYSTVADLLRLVRAADVVPGFDELTSSRFQSIPAPHGPDRRIQNRNALLWLYPGAFGTKTGSTAGAGFCVVGAAERDGRRLVAVVLGAPQEPFSDAASLLNYGFEGFSQRTFLHEGGDLGSVSIRGGTVPVVAGATLSALVPTSAIDLARIGLVVDPKAAFPPAPGERIGSVRVRVPGLTLGVVPLVVPAVPPPPPASGPWWARAASAVGRSFADAVGAIAG